MNLSTFLPIDRYRALNRDTPLADRAFGTALFADISGFTPLSEKLANLLGPRRGAEELSLHLNQIYEALIECIHRYQGSVIGFSGDAITCWFDGPIEETAHLAVTAAWKMQQTMATLSHLKIGDTDEVVLALKVAIAAGPVRRLVVGDPAMQLRDVLAGATVERMAQAEHFARPGQIVLAPEVREALGGKVEVSELETDIGLVLLLQLLKSASARFWDELVFQPEGGTASEEQLKPWVLPAVYARLKAGMSGFLTELRPVVVFFLRFEGLDYDGDDQAGAKLDQFIRWTQTVASDYDGNLLDLIIGDKGSYVYFAFGAPVAHQNEVERALRVATTLRTPPPALSWVRHIGIGMSQGTLRTGLYGGSSRHTYGVLGDEVNLAARLMQKAGERQILVSHSVRQAAGVDPHFSWQLLPDLQVKGKTEPVKVYSLLAEVETETLNLSEPDYRLPMLGRANELALIGQKIELARQGHSQIVALSGEAGLGKSRLVAETVRLGTEQELAIYGGAAQSYGTQMAYLAWQPVWRGLFELTADWTVEEQEAQLTSRLEQLNPDLLPRLPLLGAVLNLPLADNALTGSFNGALRKASLETLLVDCLKAQAKRGPLMLVLEDCHWLDPLSVDLLEAIGRAILELPVVLVLAYRPAEAEQVLSDRLSRLPHCTEIHLTSLSQDEMTQLIELKLGQTNLPARLTEKLIAQADGNPFYMEELVNFLLDKVFDWHSNNLDEVELPASLHNLVLSRLDQLNEVEKGVLKVASVVGRLFKANWLWEIYPAVGDPEVVLGHLEKLDRLDLTLLSKTTPELEYLFKHIVTRDVAYESLAHATRVMLHEQVGAYIEQTYQTRLEQYLDLLAYHYERSLNKQKQREYLLKAAQAAQAVYSNQIALDYYRRLLPLCSEEEQIDIKLQMCQILELIAEWPEVIELYQNLLKLAEQKERPVLGARVQKGLGIACLRRGYFSDATQWLEKARLGYAALEDKLEVANVLLEITDTYWRQADYARAQEAMEQSLSLLRELDDQASIAAAINKQAQMCIYQDNYARAGILLSENLIRRRTLGDKRGIFASLNNLAVHLYHNNKDYSAAAVLLKEALEVLEEIGDRLGKIIVLENLGIIAYYQKNYAQAHHLLYQSLYLCRELDINHYAFQAIGVLVGVIVAEKYYREAARIIGGLTVAQQNLGLRLEAPEEQIYQPAMQILEAGWSVRGLEEEFQSGQLMSMSETLDFILQKAQLMEPPAQEVVAVA